MLVIDLKYNLHQKIMFVLPEIEKLAKMQIFKLLKSFKPLIYREKGRDLYKVFKYCFGHLE